MSEPSVLDYVKGLLNPRRKTPKIPALPKEKPLGRSPRVRPTQTTRARRPVDLGALPWRSVAALILFFTAQYLWAPPQTSWQNGVVVGVAATALAIWAATAGEWRLPEIEKAQPDKKALRFRQVPLVLGLLFFGLTFFFSGGNRFTLLNVSLWLLSILFVLAAFWQSKQSPRQAWQKMLTSWKQREWTFQISRWTLVVLVAIVVIAFFRFSQLDAAPPEMNSDHAEKLLDVNDIFQGQTSIFFERNTGREPLQFYLTAAVAQIFGTGISFMSLKLGTVILAFISLIYIYLLGKELGGRWVGLLALLLVGIAFWPNLLARTGLRFSLYPTLAAPTLYYLLRGLRRGTLNDYLLSGLFMGIGLNGYTAFRIMPIVAGVALVIFALHTSSADLRRRGLIGFALLALVALVICTPLVRYAVEHPAQFGERTITRMFEAERAYAEPVWLTFIKNVRNGLGMFNYSGGNIWLVGISGRPAFDLISAALLPLGAIIVGIRYWRRRHWLDLFLLLAIPLMMLPSTLSLAFPDENPAMNRASGAWIPAFLICALALDAFLHGLRDKLGDKAGLRVAQLSGIAILSAFAVTNYFLFFGEYVTEYARSSWNTSELGNVIADYADSFGSLDSAWVVSYAYWVDTRLVGMNAGNPSRDYGIWPDQLNTTLETPAPKLFLLKPEDELGLTTLQQLYPNGIVTFHQSRVPTKEFITFFVPESANQ